MGWISGRGWQLIRRDNKSRERSLFTHHDVFAGDKEPVLEHGRSLSFGFVSMLHPHC
jgi:hypothetical protein